MKLVVGSNGEFGCTKNIIDASDGSVDEIYLSVKNSVYSSGRPDVKELKISDLEEHLRLVKRTNTHLSVAFNSTCYSGRENSFGFRKEFEQFLDSIGTVGIEKIILAHPVLIGLAKKTHPNMHISVSSFNMVDNDVKVKYFLDMGVNRIILAAELNRHPEKLQKIINKYPNTEFEVILNNGCNYYCQFEYSHGASQSHMQEYQGIKSNHYPARCIKELLSEKWRILTSPFIRPEDLEFYEKMGVKFFKLAGRNTTAEWILNSLNAYQKRIFKGNIIDILNRTYNISSFRNESPLINIPNEKIDSLLKLVADSDDYMETCNKCKKLYEELNG